MAVSLMSRVLLPTLTGLVNACGKQVSRFSIAGKWCYHQRSVSSTAGISQKIGSKLCPQPSPWSHPHILQSGEITPWISKVEYQKRRSSLMNALRKSSDRTKANLVIIPSAAKVYMSEKIPYVYRQHSDFFYLTGCLEPDIVLVLASPPNSDEFEPILFLPKADPHTEVWEGPKVDTEFCLSFLGIPNANEISYLPAFLSSFIKEHNFSGVQIWRDSVRHSSVIDDVISQNVGSYSLVDIVPMIHQQRLIKSSAEQALMRKSCEIIASSVQETMKITKPSICESQLWATVDYHSRMKGAQYLAYPPVVAGGPRANTIHYISNNQLTQDGEMVLMDAGCQYYGYSSDLTRCWPVNGRFSAAQRAAYEAVLDVQLDLIKFCQELPTLDDLFQRMCRQLGRNLSELGFGKSKNIMNGTCIERIQMAYSFCPHHVSHYLGIDVHDTGRVKRNIPLKPGMIITIEPGLYVDLNRSMAPEMFHGIGLRIEDDILITDTGSVEVLTRSCPKNATDIEQTMIK